jgi:Spy/CpxP family protein refolding chaperone
MSKTLHFVAKSAGLVLLSGAFLQAQQGGAPAASNDAPFPPGAHRPPMERAFHMGPPGRWWQNPNMSAKLNLTADQKKKMDDIFQQNRLNLIDLHANLEKQEAILDPLVQADQPDEGKVLAQIDKVAEARANLEKANARMLLGLRRTLTPQQWQQVKAMAPPEMRGGMGMGGPGMRGRHMMEPGGPHVRGGGIPNGGPAGAPDPSGAPRPDGAPSTPPGDGPRD